MIGDVYEDLAMHADAAGVLFSDDAYIRDTDNLGPWARNNPAKNTQALIDFTLELAGRMQRWRPQLRTARNMFARPILETNAEAWTGQSLPAFVKAYDLTAVMAMPQLDQQSDNLALVPAPGRESRRDSRWLRAYAFRVRHTNWRTHTPIDDRDLVRRMRTVQAEGARHIGYYPDDFFHNQPDLETIRPFISASDYPYPRSRHDERSPPWAP